jgi:hypothetical protein
VPAPSEIGVSVDNTVKVTPASSHPVLFNILFLYPSWTCRTCNDQSITAAAAVANIVRQPVNIT